jgi:hypothetical protein
MSPGGGALLAVLCPPSCLAFGDSPEGALLPRLAPSSLLFVRGVAIIVALVAALAVVSGASASRKPTSAELLWMQQAGFVVGAGTFRDWAIVSTADPYFGVYFKRRCSAAGTCPASKPTYAFLLRRQRLTHSARWSLIAQAELRPRDAKEVGNLCRVAPPAAKRDLLGAICRVAK